MKLSEAIRLGSIMTEQASGIYFDVGVGGKPETACALGAALIAAGMTQDIGAPYFDRLYARWPMLDLKLAEEIVRRNDSGESRESIADWVETLEKEREANGQVCGDAGDEGGVIEAVHVSPSEG